MVNGIGEKGSRDRVSRLAVLALGACAILLVVLSQTAVAAKAKPKGNLYTISLATKVRGRNDREPDGETPPYGCKGDVTETFRYSASGHTDPAPSKVPLQKYGHFRYFDFPGQLKGLSASLTEDITGSWALDPTLPFLPDPSVCVFQPTHTVGHCRAQPRRLRLPPISPPPTTGANSRSPTKRPGSSVNARRSTTRSPRSSTAR